MFHYLFQPLQVRGRNIKNRISMPAMHLHYVQDGTVTDQLLGFYRERALGGAGLIIVGGCSIDDIGGGPGFIGLSDDSFLPGLKTLTTTIQQKGALAMAQLYHAGKYAPSQHIGGKQAVSASAIRSKLTGEMPKALDKAGIETIQNAFVQASLRAQKAGFDGVELISSAGYLICQFLSLTTNKREDEYGGSLENRARFGVEIIQKIRAQVDENFIIQARLSGNDFVKGGNTNTEWQQIAQMYEKAGADIFNVTGGWHETKVPQITMSVPHGAYIYLAAGIKRAVSIPVIASNRINSPKMADEFIRQEMADMINFGRPLIADPYLPEKAWNFRSDEINQCIACNQGCFDSVFADRPVQCLVNPMVSRESQIKITRAEKKKKVVVVGGGVAGMKAALTAVERKHKVIIYERRLFGGQMDIVAASPDRHEFATLEENLKTQIFIKSAKKKIKIRHESATLEKIEKEKPDAVIIATGGREIRPNIPGIENAVSAWSVLRKEPKIGQNIVIIGGGAVGCETALALAHTGTIDADTTRFLIENEAEDMDTIRNLILYGPKKVTIVEMMEKIGKDIGITTRWTIMQDLKRHKVNMLTQTKVVAIELDGILCEHNGEQKKINADMIVYAVGTKSENSLYDEVKDKFPQVFLIGDAKKPRKAMDAIHEGFFAALEI